MTGRGKINGTFRNIFGVFLLFALIGCGEEPTGMDAPLSSTSRAVFEQSLAQLGNEVTAAEHQQLKRAVNYLNVNQTEFESLDDFYASLDGLTPNQIIQRADELKAKRQGDSG